MSIYFLTPDYSFPSGGVRVIYRHVDILNKHGIPAYVLHRKAGFRCTWFENDTPVVYWDSRITTRISRKIDKILHPEKPLRIPLQGADKDIIDENDFLVFPEIYGPGLIEMAPDIPKVILNQNCYLTFRGYPPDESPIQPPYYHPDIQGVLCNSEDGIDYLKYAFPGVAFTRFHLSINPHLFRHQETKKRQICYTPRKNDLIVRQVISILKIRNSLNGFDFVPFAGVSQQEVARIMGESALFLSFGQHEGFGLPPAEAMACGCIVIGYHAGGGREFMKPEFSYPIEYGEVIGFARTIEEVIRDYDADPERFAEMGRAASDYVLSTYTPQREEEDVLRFWNGLLNPDQK